jgi:predicted transcriptional regulator
MDITIIDSDFSLELPEALKQAIEKAKEQLNEGKGIPHTKVMEEIKSKYL